MTAPELKPCPFCGSDDIRQEYGAGSKPPHNDPYVLCVDCGCSIVGMAGSWNRRADLAAVQPAQVHPDPRDEVIARLVEALRDCDGGLGALGVPRDAEPRSTARAALAAAKAVMK